MIRLTGTIEEYGFPILKDVRIVNPVTGNWIGPSTIIDTGASEFYLKTHLIETLGLSKIGNSFTINPVHGRQPVNVYEGYLNIGENEFGIIQIREIFGSYPLDFIIGCAFLKGTNFNYDGKEMIFEITI
jgi:hypothetical protein